MQKNKTVWLSLLFALPLMTHAEPLPEEPGDTRDQSASISAAPIAFSSGDWGTAIGVSGITTGLLQPQMSIFGTAIYSNNDSWLGFAGISNIMIPKYQQWLFDVNVLEGHYRETNYFVAGNPDFEGTPPGSNDSSGDNYIRTAGREAHYWARFRYILPIGEGRNGAIASLLHKEGEANDSGRHWNPLSSGFTTLELQPFFRRRDLGHMNPEHEDSEAMGVRFIMEYDNRDSSQLPTRGSNLAFTYNNDWGSTSRASWSTWELEYSKFFNLGTNQYMRQKVLALNAWLSDTPTWNDTETIEGEQHYRRPPSFAGVRLGGWDKMRGFETNRFHGRSAVAYTAEFRMMPDWQPLQDLPLVGELYEIPWWQWAVFIDAGRVADTFSLSELHTDMKYSIGGSIRFKVEGITIRTEIAASEEDTMFRVFINQPF